MGCDAVSRPLSKHCIAADTSWQWSCDPQVRSEASFFHQCTSRYEVLHFRIEAVNHINENRL